MEDHQKSLPEESAEGSAPLLASQTR